MAVQRLAREKAPAAPGPKTGTGQNRLFDLVAAILGVVVIWPIWMLIAVLIRLDSPGPILYHQERVGKKGRRYTIYKFRTMVEGAEKQQREIGDFAAHRFQPLSPPGRDPRTTFIGWVLRRTSLDESPQLLNVVKGDMSLVGPRPEVPRIVAAYPLHYHRRHEVKPGLTGLAQVNGRSDITYEEKIMYDLEYVRRSSFPLDLWILFKTIRVVLTQQGAR